MRDFHHLHIILCWNNKVHVARINSNTKLVHVWKRLAKNLQVDLSIHCLHISNGWTNVSMIKMIHRLLMQQKEKALIEMTQSSCSKKLSKLNQTIVNNVQRRVCLRCLKYTQNISLVRLCRAPIKEGYSPKNIKRTCQCTVVQGMWNETTRLHYRLLDISSEKTLKIAINVGVNLDTKL